jgi:hypothetical protein
MSEMAFNVALGKIAHYASLPAANDALVLIPLEHSGLETDAVLRDKDTFADVVSGATNEQTTIGRKTLTGVTVTVDDTNDRVSIGFAAVSWTAPTGNKVGAFVIGYVPDTTAPSDAAIIPLTKHDVGTDGWTPEGIAFGLNAGDFFRASSSA